MQYNKEFEKNGFTVLKKIISKKLIREIEKDIENVKKKVVKLRQLNFHKTDDGKFNTIHNINKFYKKGKLFGLVQNKKINKALNLILGKKLKLRNLEFFLKPAKTGMPSPYHQDNYYWNIIGAEAVNVWIAFTESNKKNGGICYLKGSHCIGTLKHNISYMKGSSQKISNGTLKKLKFKKHYPNLKPGDCIIHHPEVIHGSERNASNKDRIGVVLSFMKKSAKIDKIKLREYKKKVNKNLKNIYN